jgi:hypothetical protein
MTDGGAHGVMDLIECLEKLISEAPITYVSRLVCLILLFKYFLMLIRCLHFSDVNLN